MRRFRAGICCFGLLLLLTACSASAGRKPLPRPDLLLVAGEQGGLVAYDTIQGTEIHRFKFPLHSQVAVSPGGDRLWLLTAEQRPEWKVRTVTTDSWAEKAGPSFRDLADYKIFSPYVALSRDGRWLYAEMRQITGPGQDKLWLEVYDTKEAKWTGRKLDLECRPWGTAAVTDGVAVLCGSYISILSRNGGAPVQVTLPKGGVLKTHNADTSVAVVSAADGTLFTAQRDGTVAALDPQQGKLLRHGRPALPDGWGIGVGALATSPDGTTLYVGVGDPLTAGGLREIWVLEAGTFATTSRIKPPAEFGSIALSPDGRSLYALAEDTVHVMDAATGKSVRAFKVKTETRPSFLIAPGGP